MDLTRYFGDAALWFALLAPIVAAFTTLASPLHGDFVGALLSARDGLWPAMW